MERKLVSGVNTIKIHPTNVTLNRGDNWTSVKKIDFGSSNVTFNPTTISRAKHYARSTTLLEFTSGKLTNTDAYNMFNDCTNLVKMTTQCPNVTNAYNMFSGCSKLTTLNAGSFSSVVTATCMFYGCSSLTNVSSIGTMAKVKNGENMFGNCYKLTSVSLAPTGITNCQGMFYGCSSLTTTTLGTLSALTDSSSMYALCSSLVSLHSAHLTCTGITNGYRMFLSCSSLSYVSQMTWNNLTNGESMFEGCKSLTGTSVISLQSLSNGNRMFFNCSALTANCIGKWTTDLKAETPITKMDGMFYNCQNIMGVYGFDVSNVTSMSNTFYNCKKCYIFGLSGLCCDCDLSYTRLGRKSDTDDTYQAFYINYIVTYAKSCAKTLTVPSWLSGNTDAVARFNILTGKGWTVKYVAR